MMNTALTKPTYSGTIGLLDQEHRRHHLRRTNVRLEIFRSFQPFVFRHHRPGVECFVFHWVLALEWTGAGAAHADEDDRLELNAAHKFVVADPARHNAHTNK